MHSRNAYARITQNQLTAGVTPKQLLLEYPFLEPEDLTAAMNYADTSRFQPTFTARTNS